MILIFEFLQRIGFDKLMMNSLRLDDHRKFFTASYYDHFKQKLLINIAGYLHDSAANYWRLDPAMTAVLGKEQLVSQPSLSRFFGIIQPENLDEFRELL